MPNRCWSRWGGLKAVLFPGLLACVTASAQGGGKESTWCEAPRPAAFEELHRVPVADTWFEVYDVAPGVFALYEPRQAERTISYLITGTRRAVLFDTGMGIGDIRRVAAQLTQLPVTVLNSHTHNDHVGGNWQFATVKGMDTEFTRVQARGSRADAQSELAAGQICGDLPAGFHRGTYRTRPWRIASVVHDGDRLDLGERVLTAIATPGHTPDSISVLDTAQGLLFTGDTFYPGTIWLYRPETDLHAYDVSIRRLAGLQSQVRLVLGAHNLPVAPPTVLPELVAAFEAVRAGRVEGASRGAGKVEYKVREIAFLMHAP